MGRGAFRTAVRRTPLRRCRDALRDQRGQTPIDLLIEHGVADLSLEKVARRAGVGKTTIYRRFPDKSALLLAAVSGAQAVDDERLLDWPDAATMLASWALHLSDPRNRRLLRRLFASIDDLPELLPAYRAAESPRRQHAEREALRRAQAVGQLPEDADIDAIADILAGAILQHLTTHPDDESAARIDEYLTRVLTQVGYTKPDRNPS
ncbi:TetR/AcrR family transcriptional regulator [Microbacterium bovistercoris]|uniref:TetR/AcrR family transcriptional regulator n=1 Tax=Microbacterium bovistercoris TaxID=2293570 RepID=A0A371NU47_9MICO|nr:TetR/AcrR family transcriptional regulator [Microbacterium bovistercoris]REJ05857.1 TetR/AcrR family transcriptional regulator [Microbacterium bovistercoris]